MFGSPIRTTLVLSLLFILVGGGYLHMLLNDKERHQDVAEREVVHEQADTPVWVLIRSAHEMESVSLTVNGEEVSTEQFTPREVEAEVEVSFPMVVKLNVVWPLNTPETAVLISVEPEGEAAIEETVWALGAMTREFEFQLEDQ